MFLLKFPKCFRIKFLCSHRTIIPLQMRELWASIQAERAKKFIAVTVIKDSAGIETRGEGKRFVCHADSTC